MGIQSEEAIATEEFRAPPISYFSRGKVSSVMDFIDYTELQRERELQRQHVLFIRVSSVFRYTKLH